MNKIGLLLIIVMGLTSCSDKNHEGHGELGLTIKGRYNGEALVMNQNYKYFDGSDINFTRSEWFISDIELVKGTDTTLLKDYDFIAFNDHTNLTKAEAGVHIHLANIPEGNYSQIRFKIGLPPELNKKDPADFQVGDPLSEGTNYWAGWKSYIFSKTEGNITNSQGISKSFAFHSGFDTLMQQVVLNKIIEIDDDATSALTLELDHKRLFGDQQNYLDIISDPIFHDLDDTRIFIFMDRFKNSFSIK